PGPRAPGPQNRLATGPRRPREPLTARPEPPVSRANARRAPGRPARGARLSLADGPASFAQARGEERCRLGLHHELYQTGLLSGGVLDADVLDVDPGPSGVGEDAG